LKLAFEILESLEFGLKAGKHEGHGRVIRRGVP
jgi:hypothetical protein